MRPSAHRMEPVLLDPLPDQATQVRGWEKDTFIYPNGATVAYPTYGLNNEDRPGWLKDDHLYSLMAPGILLYDLFSMPVYMVVEPPWKSAAYPGMNIPPTMTLADPLPAAPTGGMPQEPTTAAPVRVNSESK